MIVLAFWLLVLEGFSREASADRKQLRACSLKQVPAAAHPAPEMDERSKSGIRLDEDSDEGILLRLASLLGTLHYPTLNPKLP